MFSDLFWHILSDNMSAILELNSSRESRILRLLFFSTAADVQDNYLNIKILKIKSEYKNKLYIHMKIIILSKKINNDNNHAEAKKSSLLLSDIKKEVSCTFF